MADAAFPRHRFAGSHRRIGRDFGEACVDPIRRHLGLALDRLEKHRGLGRQRAFAAALGYRRFVVEHAPYLDEEIQGVATGAGIDLAAAYLLQLRAELAVVAPTPPEVGDECTTFAVLPEATADGSPLVGQNADLPAFYRDLGVVVEFVPDDAPAVLMLTPVGQVSYIGVNEAGLGVFANYLTCDGWRVGFPRYLLSRLALTHGTVDAAIAAVRAVPRASSRNLIMLDAAGTTADLETTPTRDARLDPVDGLLAHANHYTAPALLGEERSSGKHLANSRARHAQMERLLAAERGRLDAAAIQGILRDRACGADSLSRPPGDDPDSDTMTFASVVAEPARGRLWVAVGPPHQHPYHAHHFGESAIHPAAADPLAARAR